MALPKLSELIANLGAIQKASVACVSGISRASLKKRPGGITRNRVGLRLNRVGKLLLTAAAVSAFIAPIGIGTLSAPIRVQAQATQSPAKQFEVASVKANVSGEEGFAIDPRPNYSARNVNVIRLITIAFRVQNSQIVGGPRWLESGRFDIAARGAVNSTAAGINSMVQNLLVDRFKLAFHMETKELRIYTLTVAKNGPKLKNPLDGRCAAAIKASQPCTNFAEFKNGLIAENVSLPTIARALGRVLGDRVVVDKTGLTGQYDIAVMWKNGAARPSEEENNQPVSESPDSPFVALQEQAGLKLVSSRGLVDVMVIDHVEKPSEN